MNVNKKLLTLTDEIKIYVKNVPEKPPDPKSIKLSISDRVIVPDGSMSLVPRESEATLKAMVHFEDGSVRDYSKHADVVYEVTRGEKSVRFSDINKVKLNVDARPRKFGRDVATIQASYKKFSDTVRVGRASVPEFLQLEINPRELVPNSEAIHTDKYGS